MPMPLKTFLDAHDTNAMKVYCCFDTRDEALPLSFAAPGRLLADSQSRGSLFPHADDVTPCRFTIFS